MQKNDLPHHKVYTPAVVDFVTVAAEMCLTLEEAAQYSRADFTDKMLKLLPMLYLKAAMVTPPETVSDDAPEQFVTENDYLFVREQAEQILGEADSYLEVFHPDMPLSDSPVAAFVSEDLADIYQEIKDFAMNYQTLDTDVMNDALAECINAFGSHWGQKTLNALRALHSFRYSENFADDEETETLDNKKDNNFFTRFFSETE
ncbi:MAG: DUF5063 domain-containing protein [Paludibacter sp.]|jgi:hypothetical protein|nr:DUF5063 domain-containing protein [Paludibacter sp.]